MRAYVQLYIHTRMYQIRYYVVVTSYTGAMQCSDEYLGKHLTSHQGASPVWPNFVPIRLAVVLKVFLVSSIFSCTVIAFFVVCMEKCLHCFMQYFSALGRKSFPHQGILKHFSCTRVEILFFCTRTEKIDSFACLRFIARKEAGDEKNSIPTSNPQKLVHIHFSVSTNVLFWSLMPSLKPSLRSGFKAKVFVPRKIHQSRLKNGCTRFRGFSVGKILLLPDSE